MTVNRKVPVFSTWPALICCFSHTQPKRTDHLRWAMTCVSGEHNGCCGGWWCSACCAQHSFHFCIATHSLFQVSVQVSRFLYWFLVSILSETPSKVTVILVNSIFRLKTHKHFKTPNISWGHNSLPPFKSVMKTYSEVPINIYMFWDALTAVQTARKGRKPCCLCSQELVSCRKKWEPKIEYSNSL